MFHEDRQREIDYHSGVADERKRFRAPPLGELPTPEPLRAPLTLAEFMESEDERERACHAIERNLDRNGIPETQTTHVRLF